MKLCPYCRRCGKKVPAVPGKSRCQDHLDQQAAYMERRRRGLVDQGKCRECGADLPKDYPFRTCNRCRRQDRLRRRGAQNGGML